MTSVQAISSWEVSQDECWWSDITWGPSVSTVTLTSPRPLTAFTACSLNPTTPLLPPLPIPSQLLTSVIHPIFIFPNKPATCPLLCSGVGSGGHVVVWLELQQRRGGPNRSSADQWAALTFWERPGLWWLAAHTAALDFFMAERADTYGFSNYEIIPQ